MENDWKKACPESEIEMNSTRAVLVDGVQICIFRLEDGLFATHDVCTHGQASLADGYVEDNAIECPLHQGTFDIRTGKALSSPCVIDLKIFPIKSEHGTIFLKLE